MKLKSFVLSLSLAAILGGYAAPSFGMETHAVGTKEGCINALQQSMYEKGNFDATMRKIKTKHWYSMQHYREKDPELTDSAFDEVIIEEPSKLLSFITTHCTYQGVTTSGTGIDKGASCYFNCKNIRVGIYRDPSTKEQSETENIKVSYKKDRDKADKYYLLSIYPAMPDK